MMNSTPLFRIAGALALALSLAACSGLPESKKVEYKSAAKLPPLDIPPDLTQPARDDRYAVPDVSAKGTATYSAYAGERRAGGASTSPVVLPDAAQVRIERAGTQRWLVAAGTAEQLWPQLKEFWHEAGLTVALERPEAGVMETEWAENRAKLPLGTIRSALARALDVFYSTAERDKFRTRLEKGTTPGTVEIYISHRGMQEVYINEGKSDTRWQPRPADPELEAEMLQRLMVKLGATSERATQQLAAPAPAAERARLQSGADGSALVLQEAFDRAWRRVGLALDRVGFTVEDRDRAQGVYFVRYIDPAAGSDKPGWFARLWSDKPAEAQTQYRIQVVGEGAESRVRVLTREGGADNSATAGRILGLLHEQLK